MSRHLTEAHRQWAMRPSDERFATLDDLREYCLNKHRVAKTAYAELPKMTAEVVNNDVVIVGKSGKPNHLTHWSFQQLCQRADIGKAADYLRTLPAEMVATLLNYHFTKTVKDKEVQILLNVEDERRTIRSLNGTGYARIWDYEVVDRLRGLQEQGWTIPPARSSNGSDNAGLYAGDRDMFVFMVNENNRINDGSDQGLARGFFISNSEVGAAAWAITLFLYRYVCGNHIVWFAQDVTRFSVRHIGDADSKTVKTLQQELSAYADALAAPVEQKILAAKAKSLGKDDEIVIDRLFRRRVAAQRDIAEALATAKVHEDTDGDPRSVWGMVQGFTRLSQKESFAERRVLLDKAAGSLLDQFVA